MSACVICGVELVRRPKETTSNFARRLACSKEHGYLARGTLGLREARAATKVIREWPRLTWSPPVPVPCQDFPELFMPPTARGGWDSRPAQRICQRCPVIQDCLAWAITDERPDMGVWGGERFVDGRPVRLVTA